MKTYSRVYAKIDLDAVTYNMEQMKQRVNGNTKIMAVIKSDGYGHGAVQVAEVLKIRLIFGVLRWLHLTKRLFFARKALKNQIVLWMHFPRPVFRNAG